MEEINAWVFILLKAANTPMNIVKYGLSASTNRTDTAHSKTSSHAPLPSCLDHAQEDDSKILAKLSGSQKHMFTVGENTFGSTGQPYSFELVGGATARICTKKDIYPDGREFVGYGIKPAVEIKPQLRDYLQKKDPVLTKATELVQMKIK